MLKQLPEFLTLTFEGTSSFQWLNIRGEVGGTKEYMFAVI